jgi:predicted permease
MDQLLNDLRLAARSLARTPGFTLGAGLVLALGIGANAAIFSLVDAVLFRPLPVERPDELVRVYAREATSFAGSDGISNSSYPVFEDYRDHATSFAALAAYADALPVHLAKDSGRPERLTAGVVTGRYFEVLGVRAQAGRLLGAADDGAPGREPVVVLSDRLWRRLFGGDARAVGASVRLNGHAFTVVGVAPAGFYGVSLDALPQLWVPASMAPVALPEFGGAGMLADRRFSWLDMVGRLKPGVSMATAQAELDTIATRRAVAQTGNDKDPHAKLLAARDAVVDPYETARVRRLSWLLLGAAGLVLLIACADTVSLLLVRGERRREEIAIRLAIGASRGRLVRQLLVESLLLGGLGAAAGVAVAYWTVGLMRAAIPDGFPIPTVVAAGIDPRVLAFAVVSALVGAVAFGLAPALRASGTELVPALKRVPAARRRFGRALPQEAFVGVQVALAGVLLAGALLLVQSLWRANRADVGFPVDGGSVALVDLDRQGYDEARGLRFWADLLERLRATPGIRAAAVARTVPLQSAGMRISLSPEGFTPPPGQHVNADYDPVAPGFFHALGASLVRGRDFLPTDVKGAPLVAVVNQAAADRYWPGQDPIGKRILDAGPADQPLEVVGVVRTVKNRELREPPTPTVYVPVAQFYMGRMTVLVRSDLGEAAIAAAVASAVQSLDPELPVFGARTLRAQLGATLAQERVVGVLLAGFALLAVLLAGTGLHAVVAQATQARTREFAIRSALGSRPGEVTSLVLRRGLRPALAGAALALGLAAALGRTLESLLYETKPLDPLSLVATVGALGLLALAASAWPARRASRLDPAAVLREP